MLMQQSMSRSQVQTSQKIIEYLSNPNNEFTATRTKIAPAIGMSHRQLCRLFSGSELTELYQEALKIRRKSQYSQSATIDQALYDKAVTGDVPAIRLYKQCMEGFGERTFHEETHVIIAPDIAKGDEKGVPVHEPAAQANRRSKPKVSARQPAMPKPIKSKTKARAKMPAKTPAPKVRSRKGK